MAVVRTSYAPARLSLTMLKAPRTVSPASTLAMLVSSAAPLVMALVALSPVMATPALPSPAAFTTAPDGSASVLTTPFWSPAAPPAPPVAIRPCLTLSVGAISLS